MTRTRLRDPALRTVVAVVFFISAIGQALVQAYVHDDSIVTTAVLSALGSVFLAAAIVVAARRHDRRSRCEPAVLSGTDAGAGTWRGNPNAAGRLS